MALQRPLPVAAATGETARLTGLAPTTLRRLACEDPSFPRPFRLGGENGDYRWPVAEIVTWLEAKAGRPLTRDERAA